MSQRTRTITVWAAAIMLAAAPVSAWAEQPPRATPGAPRDSVHAGPEHGHPHHHHGERNFRAGAHFIVNETAGLLGMDRSELIRSLASGKTLAGLAKEKKGWSEEQYVQKLSEAASLKLDEFVREGKLKPEDAAKLKPGLPVLIKRSLNRTAQLHQVKPSPSPAATKAP
ncbi:hypothetical protein [Paenibacillus piscarius]|uniref:hypothetical protein n=1 Tax=Paenibacillus piscarius TaxID=1089681 RepID=UPI001EE7905F|nr:hypothetical protein [Paenibacillus piscarius]